MKPIKTFLLGILAAMLIPFLFVGMIIYLSACNENKIREQEEVFEPTPKNIDYDSLVKSDLKKVAQQLADSAKAGTNFEQEDKIGK